MVKLRGLGNEGAESITPGKQTVKSKPATIQTVKPGKRGPKRQWATRDTVQVRWLLPAQLVNGLKIKALKEGRSQQDILTDILKKEL